MMTEHYTILSKLFRYPFEGYRKDAEEAQKMLDALYPEAGKEISRFTEYIRSANDDKVEELFTKTFDVQPISYLDIGYVLFVEDYKRGEFLVNMKREQDEAGNTYENDLPDNLVHVLTLLPKLDNKPDFREDLVARALVPAVKKMLDEFKEARVQLKLKVIRKMHKAIIDEELNTGNVFQHALKALLMVLESDFADAIRKIPATILEKSSATQNFLRTNINTNNNILL